MPQRRNSERLGIGGRRLASGLMAVLASLAAGDLAVSRGAFASTSGPIRLTPRTAVGHPGRQIHVTLANGSARSITFNPCLQLARTAGRAWRPILESDGHRLSCSAVAQSESAHSRVTLTVHLPSNLVPARYRVSLQYRVGRRKAVLSTSFAVTAVCASPRGARVLAGSGGDGVAEVSVPGTMGPPIHLPDRIRRRADRDRCRTGGDPLRRHAPLPRRL